MNSAQFISHHLFVAAVGKPSNRYTNSGGALRSTNHSTQAARPVSLEVLNHSEPLPTALLRTIVQATSRAS